MIFSKLNVLLAERNLKISKVAKDTGISRTTLTALSQNTSQGIQFETLDLLCGYLKITPNLFFEYIPYAIEISATSLILDKSKVNNSFSEYKVNKGGMKIEFSVSITKYGSRLNDLVHKFTFEGKNQKEFRITKENIEKNGQVKIKDTSIPDIKIKDNNGFQDFMNGITKEMSVPSKVYIKNYINNKVNEEIVKIINDNIKSKLMFKLSVTKRVIDSFNTFFE